MSRPTAATAGDAAVLIEQAADAAGMTVEQLAKTVIDLYGKKLAKPNAHERLSRKELGLALWRDLQRIAKPNRGAWYQELADEQKISLIVALRHEGYRSDVIARDLNIAQTQVSELYNRYADTVGSQVSMVRVSTILGAVTADLELAQEGMRNAGDWKGYWAARAKYVSILQDLGVVERAAQRIDINHNFEQAKKAEIDGILLLEEKKKQRQAEIREVEFEVQGG